MTKAEYWIGKDVDYREIWSDYNSGHEDYIEKFKNMRVYLIRIEFEYPPASLPLFNHEAVYKTIKGYFHDIKQKCFSEVEYDEFGPLFLYEINRGSVISGFLAELLPLCILAWALKNQLVLGVAIENQDKKIKLLKENFPNINFPDEVLDKFFKAQTPDGMAEAVSMLYKQGIRGVQISQEPFDGADYEKTKMKRIN